MRMLVVNPNTTVAMPESIAGAACRYASAGTEIVALTASFGVDGIDSAFERLLSAVAVMDRVTTYPEPFDAVVMAGFGEHGREGLMELLDVPVVDVAEASAHVAMLLGRCRPVSRTSEGSGWTPSRTPGWPGCACTEPRRRPAGRRSTLPGLCRPRPR